MTDANLSAWIRSAHEALAPQSVECAGAAWGPVRLRHRTTSPGWFSGFDRAWARPLGTTTDGATDGVTIDLITAPISDLPASITPPAITHGRLGARGEVIDAPDEGVLLVWGQHTGEIIGWDLESSLAICLRMEPPNGYEVVSPLRSLVHWSTIRSGGVLMHGASVGIPGAAEEPGRGLLLVGEAGYGKSTSTLACLERGWITCGDDAVALFADDRGWRAHAVYGAVKTKLDAEVNPADVPNAVTWEIAGTKRAHLLTSTDEQHLVKEMALDGIVLLDPDADPDEPWRETSPAHIRTAAAPSSALPLPYCRTEILGRIGQAAHDLHGFVLPRRRTLAQTVEDLDSIREACHPRVSVIVPVYRGAAFVTDAINSVLNQRRGRFEIIVVDDASPDDSIELIEELRPQIEQGGHRLVVVRHATNLGVTAARNSGLRACTEPFITFLDQDDIWSPSHTEILTAIAARDDASVAIGGVSFEDLGSEQARTWMRSEWFTGDHTGHVLGAMLVHRDVIGEIGEFDERLTAAADDVDWIMRIRDAGIPTTTSPDVVLTRRIHDTNQTASLGSDSRDLLRTVRAHMDRARRATDSTPLPVVDVVIPIHNRVEYLRAAVDSARAQEKVSVRIFVVDDGSSDDVAGEVASWRYPEVHLITHAHQRGIGAARNSGARAGTSPWISFLDGDDLWFPGRSRALIDAIESSTEARSLAHGHVALFGDELGLASIEEFSVADAPPSLLPGGVLLRRSVFEQIGWFPEDLQMGEFIEWAARARSLGVVELSIARITLLRRVHERSTTREQSVHTSDYLKVVARARAAQRTLPGEPN